MNYIEELKQFQPTCDQEKSDQEIMLEYIHAFGDEVLTRQCRIGHFTASSMILNSDCTKVLMAYHNIYNSWSWTGGHADGESDMLEVALREAKEETGVHNLSLLTDRLIAIDILPVWGHIKKGSYVSAHMHLNYTYLFQADEKEMLHIKEDENSGVMWIDIAKLDDFVREPDMLPVYRKILGKVNSTMIDEN